MGTTGHRMQVGNSGANAEFGGKCWFSLVASLKIYSSLVLVVIGI